MNNYFIIGKVNEGKSYLFNLFSKEHKTISNPKENTTVDVIRKQIQDDENCPYKTICDVKRPPSHFHS